MNKRRSEIALSAALTAVVLVGCTGTDSACNKIGSNVFLCKFEDNGSFYLQKDPKNQADGGGLGGGTITAIGISKTCVAAKRLANYRGDKDGWLLFSPQGGQPRGPFTDEELRSDPTCGSVAVHPVADAWRLLSH